MGHAGRLKHLRIFVLVFWAVYVAFTVESIIKSKRYNICSAQLITSETDFEKAFNASKSKNYIVGFPVKNAPRLKSVSEELKNPGNIVYLKVYDFNGIDSSLFFSDIAGDTCFNIQPVSVYGIAKMDLKHSDCKGRSDISHFVIPELRSFLCGKNKIFTPIGYRTYSYVLDCDSIYVYASVGNKSFVPLIDSDNLPCAISAQMVEGNSNCGKLILMISVGVILLLLSLPLFLVHKIEN